MTSIQFVVHPLPGTQEQLAEKLKSVADRLNKYGQQGEGRRLLYRRLERERGFETKMQLS